MARRVSGPPRLAALGTLRGAALAIVLSMAAGVSITPARGADQTPVIIPLHVDRGQYGETRLSIDVTLATKTQRLMLDTGSTGLRVIATALPTGSYRRTGHEVDYDYGSGTVLKGEEAIASMTIGAVHGNVPLEVVDKIACSQEVPNCPDQDQFQLEMFGGSYPGVLGVYPRPPAMEGCCDNPLGALENQIGRSFVLHAAFDAPTLTLSPAPATIAGFTLVAIGALGAPQGCITVYGLGSQTCGPVIFDTGSSSIFVQTLGIVPGAPWTHALLRIGSWTRDFTIGPHPPDVKISIRRGEEQRIVIGIAALEKLDLYFDVDGRRIGLPK
jgi:hypothetical protein